MNLKKYIKMIYRRFLFFLIFSFHSTFSFSFISFTYSRPNIALGSHSGLGRLTMGLEQEFD